MNFRISKRDVTCGSIPVLTRAAIITRREIPASYVAGGGVF